MLFVRIPSDWPTTNRITSRISQCDRKDNNLGYLSGPLDCFLSVGCSYSSSMARKADTNSAKRPSCPFFHSCSIWGTQCSSEYLFGLRRKGKVEFVCRCLVESEIMWFSTENILSTLFLHPHNFTFNTLRISYPTFFTHDYVFITLSTLFLASRCHLKEYLATAKAEDKSVCFWGHLGFNNGWNSSVKQANHIRYWI